MRVISIIPLFVGAALGNDLLFIRDGLKRIDEKVLDEFENKNHVYSPMSIRVMATALMRGTSGNGLKELADVFGFNVGNDFENPKEAAYLTYMNRTFTREKPNLQQSIIWSSQKYYNLEPSYRDDIRKKCGIQLKRIKTFVGKEGYLNRQISEGTDGAIDDFFKKGQMTEEVKMMILNSFNFDEKWHKTLEMKDGPNIQHFFNLNREEVSRNVKSFTRGNRKTKVTYFKDDATGVEYIWLPFQPNKKKQPQMVFALPRFANSTRDGDDFEAADLLKDIDFSKAREFYSSFYSSGEKEKKLKSKTFVEQVVIPKFKFKTNLPLTAILKSLGIETIFDPSKTPFNRLFNNPKGLYLSEAIHKATIEVNEKGAKASAATASVIASRRTKKKLILDRPFKFFITNKRMTNVYFTGVVHKP